MPILPDELILEICNHITHEDLWLSVRNVNRQFRRCVEDVMKGAVHEHLNIGLNFSMGIGLRHRVPDPRRIAVQVTSLTSRNDQWYDIRASINFNCDEISNEYAYFDAPTFLPESCRDRASEKWKRIVSTGFDCDQAWKLSLASSDVRYACLPKLIISQHGARCNWIELLNAFFRKTVPPEQYWARQWQAV